jgi:1-acyl-sn-glycerol-3-phosphate acyltransferase
VIYWISWVFARAMLMLFGRFQVEGRANVPRRGPVILAANHVSMLDPPAIGCGIFRRAWYMAKEELFANPLLAWYLRRLSAFPVRRGAGDRSALKKALGALAAGEAVAIFPEGRRQPAGRLGEPELGVGMLALRSGAPVVPVFISGTDQMLPRRARFFHFARVRVRYGEPIVVGHGIEKPGREEYAAAAEAIMAAIRRLADA